MRRHRVDPNDPANVDLMERASRAAAGPAARRASLERMGPGGGEEEDGQRRPEVVAAAAPGMHFRLDDHHDQLTFCPGWELERDGRFRLLRMRRSGLVPELRNRTVPASEKELPKGLFEALGKK